MTTLAFKGISKRFGDVTALSGIDLDVGDGEFCVLLGPSGCGKSTLLRIVAGLTPQDEGSVLMDGRSVDGLAPRERDVAMVFQSYALYPHMTVARNLGFGLRMRGVGKAAMGRQILKTARMLGIEDLLDRKPAQLSGGQRQRVAMGRALVRRPRLFLLDEPLSNLDARLRINVRLELKRLHQEMKTTALYVTHDQVEAMTLGDRVAVMKEGMIHQIDRPEIIYHEPADTFVATFIGSPVMNLLKGRLIRVGGRLRFQREDIFIDPGDVPPDLENHLVELGIRPEDIEIGPERSENVLAGQVEMISNVGSEKYIHTRVGKTTLTVRGTKETSLGSGETVTLGINPVKSHIFHKGRRITF
jgi:multiple sugar transport system ATP-binding protein